MHTGLFIDGTELILNYTTFYRTSETEATRTHLATSRYTPSAFGQQWFSNFHRTLYIGEITKNTVAVRGDGRILSFTGNTFSKHPSINDTIHISNEWLYTYTDYSARTIEQYNNTYRTLDSITSLGNHKLTFTYNDRLTATTPKQGLLTQVTDPFGRSLNFTYLEHPSGAVLVHTVTAPDGQTLTAGYDDADNLTTLTWADGTTRTFLYERSDLPWALTGIIDETATRYATFGYDHQGRALSTEHAGGVNRYQISYSSPPKMTMTTVFNEAKGTYYEPTGYITRTHNWIAPASVHMTQPDGSTITLNAAQNTGVPRLTSRSQPAGSGCGASISHQIYDTNSNLVQRDDFNGTRTCMAYALDRNLETTRIEGLSTSQDCAQAFAASPLGAVQRKISTQWHPKWPLVTKRAEPNRITTYVYNGQPDPDNGNTIANCVPSGALLPEKQPLSVLCKKIEQPTSDTNGGKGFGAVPVGKALITRWTYNTHGKVLSKRLSDKRTFVYAYAPETTATHTQNDLISVTDPTGSVTHYTRYDRAGRLLEVRDPNGIFTRYTYDIRGRLTEQNIAGHATRYTYTPVGQLHTVTAPDTATITYTYDAAHRLIGIRDAEGHHITYTLDAAGNPTHEAVADQNNLLTRALTRHYDALQRVQRTVQGE